MCPYYIIVHLVYGILSAWRTGSETLHYLSLVPVVLLALTATLKLISIKGSKITHHYENELNGGEITIQHKAANKC